MALVCSIELHINTSKWNFNIHGIYVVYARHIPQQHIYMEYYTWYIPTIYLVGVPWAGIRSLHRSRSGHGLAAVSHGAMVSRREDVVLTGPGWPGLRGARDPSRPKTRM